MYLSKVGKSDIFYHFYLFTYLRTYYGKRKFPLSFTNQNQKGVNIEKLYFQLQLKTLFLAPVPFADLACDSIKYVADLPDNKDLSDLGFFEPR